MIIFPILCLFFLFHKISASNVLSRTTRFFIYYLDNLEFIDLSYNSFQGYLGRETFKDMYHLDLLRLQGNNKLTGFVEIVASDDIFGPSSFVADCGKPSMFEEPIMCKGCTMCYKFLVFSIICAQSPIVLSCKYT